eukprot:6883199-Alexandrium_andersonii.AAC.1
MQDIARNDRRLLGTASGSFLPFAAPLRLWLCACRPGRQRRPCAQRTSQKGTTDTPRCSERELAQRAGPTRRP